MRQRHSRGQALVELALVMPLVVLLLTGIIVFGTAIFYQQEVTNAAREAARYAATHSTTAQYTVDSHLVPATVQPDSYQYGTGDVPPTWTRMTGVARSAVFGLNRSALDISACWSGFWMVNSSGGKLSGTAYDALAPVQSPPESAYFQCTIGGVDPTTNASQISCPAPATTAADDQGSAVPENSVTVYACYTWAPPLAGFLLVPQTLTFRGVVTEVIHRQQ